MRQSSRVYLLSRASKGYHDGYRSPEASGGYSDRGHIQGNTNNTAGCDDGNACTENDVCADGACAAGTDIACDDGEGCTDDACDPASGCITTNNTAARNLRAPL